MDPTVVTKENAHQIVQALAENVKSNQHRIDSMEPVLRQMSKDVSQLTTLMVRNGFAQAVKDNAHEIKGFRKEFQAFIYDRAETCPTAKRLDKEDEDRRDRRNWRAMLTRIGIGVIALIPTVILIIEKIGG